MKEFLKNKKNQFLLATVVFGSLVVSTNANAALSMDTAAITGDLGTIAAGLVTIGVVILGAKAVWSLVRGG